MRLLLLTLSFNFEHIPLLIISTVKEKRLSFLPAPDGFFCQYYGLCYLKKMMHSPWACLCPQFCVFRGGSGKGRGAYFFIWETDSKLVCLNLFVFIIYLISNILSCFLLPLSAALSWDVLLTSLVKNRASKTSRSFNSLMSNLIRNYQRWTIRTAL